MEGDKNEKAVSADRSYVNTTKGSINQDEVDKYR